MHVISQLEFGTGTTIIVDQVCTNELIEGFYSVVVVKVYAVPREFSRKKD